MRLTLPHGKTLDLAAPALMGIVNVTPDSFSDGGAFAAAADAVAQGERLALEGAAILDIGGESTRPGARAIDSAEEMGRILPVIRELAGRVAVPISVDTVKADVAAAAIAAGASIINDVWGFQRDSAMVQVVARTGAVGVAMHNRGHDGIDPAIDIMADVLAYLTRSIDLAAQAGVERGRIVVDPGFGFGKTPEQNYRLVRELGSLRVLGCPILLGVSRKSSIGRVTGQPVAAERLAGSLAAALWGARVGASILRVHDVAAHAQGLAVQRAVEQGPG